MADYPCDFHLARYPGESHRVYVNIFRAEEKCCLKFSVCEKDLEVFLGDWLHSALYQAPEGVWNPIPEDGGLATLWMDAEPSARPLKGLRRR